MAIVEYIVSALAIMGGAKVLLLALQPLAKLTKTQKDDIVIAKVIKFLETVLEVVSVDTKGLLKIKTALGK